MIIRSIYIFKIILLYCLINLNSNGRAQTPENADNINNIGNYLEKLHIKTDRDIYISGEQVWLKIYKLGGLTGFPDNLSKVLYIELMDGQYNPVNQFKILSEDPSGSAVFRLSDTLSSGNYLICAYTRWMLNFPGHRDVYKPIYVINPFKKISNALPTSANQISDSSLTLQKGVDRSAAAPLIKAVSNQIKISITSLLNSYKQRERVRFDILTTDISGNPVDADISVSVAKASLILNEGMNDFNGHSSGSIINTFEKSPDKLPELEGELIIGTIRYNMTGEPLKEADISLSFVGKSNRCHFAKTNEKGEFVFVVKDQFGFGELVIQPLSKEIRDVYVELNQPFSSISDEYFFQFPEIDSIRLESINKAIINMQVNAIYEQFIRKPDMHVENTQNKDFYGGQARRINISDFIELTDLREIVKEILPEVEVFRKNKEVGLKVVNINQFESFKNPALVLVDGVPVHNTEALLSVSAKEFERIDIINARYFYRESVFEGIISFVTKKGNLSIMEYDDSVFRQVFEGFQPPQEFYSPVYNTDSLKNNHIPDFRNTLYWNPDIKTDASGKKVVEFYTSDDPGEYVIIVEGITSDGKPFSATRFFTVK